MLLSSYPNTATNVSHETNFLRDKNAAISRFTEAYFS